VAGQYLQLLTTEGFKMKELTRFPNQRLQIRDHYHWKIYSLFEHLKARRVVAKNEGVEIHNFIFK